MRTLFRRACGATVAGLALVLASALPAIADPASPPPSTSPNPVVADSDSDTVTTPTPSVADETPAPSPETPAAPVAAEPIDPAPSASDSAPEQAAPLTSSAPATRAISPYIEAATNANGASVTSVDVPAVTQSSVAVPGQETIAQVSVPDIASFTMVAVNWAQASDPDTQLWVRVYQGSGWSPWISYATTGKAEISGVTNGTEAGWVGSSTGIEVEVVSATGSVQGFTVTLIDTSATARTRLVDDHKAVEGYVDQPPITMRSDWGASAPADCDPAQAYDATVWGAVVHDTAGFNSYAAEDAPGIVRGLQAYHQSLGLCDIAYNFLVDRFGTIYEGRAGGIALPVHGYHAIDWDLDTVGIAVLVNGNTEAPPASALEGLAQILAWKLGNNYRDPLGEVTLNEVDLPVIFSHSQVRDTYCAGEFLDAQLSNVRNRVSDIISSSDRSEIEENWQNIGSDMSFLGSPYQLEQPIGDGHYTIFANGYGFWSPSTDTYPAWGTIGDIYMGLGGPTSFLGFPTSSEITTTADGVFQTFVNGRIYWTANTGAYSVHGAILQTYVSLGSTASFLGYPTSQEIAVNGNSDEGVYQQFEGGRIYWSPSTGSYRLHGAIGTTYEADQGPQSYLGYPVSEEVPVRDGARNMIGVHQDFQGGRIYWSDETGAHHIHGGILVRYLALGGAPSYLGFPTTEEIATDKGVYQEFAGGRIYWSEDTAAQPTHGAIGIVYRDNGGPGNYGFPTSAEVPRLGGGVSQNFENATLSWTESGGVRVTMH
ncbi:MAG: N-acetylmuramoyl-L-alanine amidase [Propionibacteriaceae bacterium]|jgi:uncharacterized protein with LGFP repeats|nr:N-acetylmuramoyl-L-alanine amidase [Propionibacteriaceae bacterium]